jgi:hypothetical protein
MDTGCFDEKANQYHSFAGDTTEETSEALRCPSCQHVGKRDSYNWTCSLCSDLDGMAIARYHRCKDGVVRFLEQTSLMRPYQFTFCICEKDVLDPEILRIHSEVEVRTIVPMTDLPVQCPLCQKVGDHTADGWLCQCRWGRPDLKFYHRCQDGVVRHIEKTSRKPFASGTYCACGSKTSYDTPLKVQAPSDLLPCPFCMTKWPRVARDWVCIKCSDSDQEARYHRCKDGSVRFFKPTRNTPLCAKFYCCCSTKKKGESEAEPQKESNGPVQCPSCQKVGKHTSYGWTCTCATAEDKYYHRCQDGVVRFITSQQRGPLCWCGNQSRYDAPPKSEECPVHTGSIPSTLIPPKSAERRGPPYVEPAIPSSAIKTTLTSEPQPRRVVRDAVFNEVSELHSAIFALNNRMFKLKEVLGDLYNDKV